MKVYVVEEISGDDVLGIARLQPKNWQMNIANGKTSTKVLNGVDGNTRKSKS